MGKPPPLPPGFLGPEGGSSPSKGEDLFDLASQPLPVAKAVRRVVPAAPLSMAYASAPVAVDRRPGVVRTMGVLSIVFGSIGTLLAVLSLVSVLLMYVNADQRGALSQTDDDEAAIAPAEPYDGDLKGNGGLGRADRAAAGSAIGTKLALSSERRAVLVRLLGEWGHDVLGGRSAAAVVEMGQLPAGLDGVGARGPQYFRTAAGLVILDDAVGRWIPTGGNGTPGRIEGELSVMIGGRRRCAVSVAEELDGIRRRVGDSFNAAQAGSLAAYLREANYSSSPDWRTLSTAELRGTTLVYSGPTGKAVGEVRVMADGRLLASLTPSGANGATGAIGGMVMSRSAAQFLVLSGIWDVALWVALVAYGIRTLAEWERGGTRHAQWAWLRLACIGIGVWATVAWISEMPQASPMREMMWMSLAIGVVLELAYPVAVLMMLRSPTMRAYYDDAGGWGTSAFGPKDRATVRRGVSQALGGAAGRAIAAALGLTAALAALTQVVVLVGWIEERTVGRAIWAVSCGVAAGMCSWALVVRRREGSEA